MTGFSDRFHYEEIVTAPDGSRYRVRLGRTGVHRWTPVEALGQYLTIITWVRYLGRRRRGWTVSVRRAGFLADRDELLSEDFPGRAVAARRADEVAEAIAHGLLLGGPPERA